ncbi:MAG: hypothetical protein ACAH17_01880 [Candidatus Paceibacterota bacterium]
MPIWFYEGDPDARLAQAVTELEERCKRKNPDTYETDIRAFIEHQLPLIYGEEEENPQKRNRMRPNWLEKEPPLDLKYVLNEMWMVWSKARIRWGDLIRKMHTHHSTLSTEH